MAELEKSSEEFEGALLMLDRLKAKEILAELADEWRSVQIVDSVVVPAMERIGSGWEMGEIALSQYYMTGRICEEAVGEILPPGSADRKFHPEIAIAVLEDFHGLGKRVVKAIFDSAGYEIRDYGVGVSVENVVRRVKEDDVKMLLLSVLMLRSALRVKTLREQLKAEGLDVKIVVGGAPFNFDQELWKEVGADATAKNASAAIETVTQMLGSNSLRRSA